MTFGDLHAFYFLISALGIFLLYLFSEGRRRKALQTFAKGELSAVLTVSADRRRRKVKVILFLAAFALSILALMRPQAGFRWEEGRRYGLDILVAVDTSRSMLTEDVKPNRLARAKIEVANLVKSLKGDRIGLIAFSGDAFLLCPLTIDYNGFMLALNSLDTDAVPTGGTSISNAITQALKSFGDGKKKHNALVLLTDGEDHEGNTAVGADKAKKEGLTIFSVGIGTEAGDLIPVIDREGRRNFLRDRQGQVVKSHLHRGNLDRIALSTGGTYIRAGDQEATLASLYEEQLLKMEKAEFEGPMKKRHREWFQIPLAIAIILLMTLEYRLGERKRVAERGGLPVLLGVLLIPVLIAACDPQSLKEANRLYAESKYEEAANRYKEILNRIPDSETIHYNLGVALYRKGDYTGAIDHFTKTLPCRSADLEAKASYNIGNSKYRLGEEIEKRAAAKAVEIYREALDYYRRAMELEGTDEDMAYNYQFVEKRLRKLVEQLKERAPDSSTSPTSGKSETDAPPSPGNKETGSAEPGSSSGEISRERADALLGGYELEEETVIRAADRKRKSFNRQVEKEW